MAQSLGKTDENDSQLERNASTTKNIGSRIGAANDSNYSKQISLSFLNDLTLYIYSSSINQ